ncbi:mandelate racemase/muconate lactonizing enzyme family protein [Tepidicaulis sp.]|uniref:mandelate racemase/muconate lactonizing enzyme family protein n=1 Tax=Tepidicaulis sp. TaxID=1920809 RepID=UPI003B59AFE3
MTDDTIIRMELTEVAIPFKEEVRAVMAGSENGLGMAIAAEEPWLGGDFVICRLFSRSGKTGTGEAFVWLPESGVSPRQIVQSIESDMAAYVLGESAFNTNRIAVRLERNIARNEIAKGLIDSACFELKARLLGRPVADLLGGAEAQRLRLAALIPLLDDTETMVGLARHWQEQGCRTFRIKLGAGIHRDAGIMRAMREALGPEAKLRVDYNQAYSAFDAVAAIKAILPFGIELIEQPCKAANFLAFAEVQKRVSVPLMAHEGCFSLEELHQLHALGGIGAVGINGERPGGVTAAVKAIHFAEQNDYGVVIHNQPSGIGSAWQVHLAAAFHSSLRYEMELFGHVMLESDLLKTPLVYKDGHVLLPDGPGWGVEIDPAALEKYAVRPTTIIE